MDEARGMCGLETPCWSCCSNVDEARVMCGQGKRVSRVVPMWMKPEGWVAWRNRISHFAPTWMKPEGYVARGKRVSRVAPTWMKPE